MLIELQCPQCGAPAVLRETDRLFTCAYCRVKSYLSARGVFRYLLPHSAPTDATLLYFPYWRFKGTMFSCVADGVRHRFLDISHPAVDAPLFPRSLGLRSQALKLRFVTPGLDGRFIRPTLSKDRVVERLCATFTQRLPGPVFHQSHIGETLSLIYAPFYVRERLYDGILNRPVSEAIEEGADPGKLISGPAGDHIRFLAAICPGCGADLEGERESLVLACRNCDTVWIGKGGGFKNLPFGHLVYAKKPVSYLPFWRIETDVAGIGLRSYADLIRVANLPKVARATMETTPFRFWTLAFKLRPQAFLRLATRITLAQPRAQVAEGLPEARIHPVTLDYGEATETLKTTLADFMKPRKTLFPRLSRIEVTPKQLRLVYVPFEDTPHDLVQPELGLAVNKAMLATAGNL